MLEIDNTINELKKSPLFNLSLASKELFHSNFLAWAIEQNGVFTKRFLQILAPELKPDFSESPIVERESNHFDLTILVTGIDGKNYRIIIENKVKSVPTVKQLVEYSNKLKKNQKDIDRTLRPVLLSLTEFDCQELGWRYLGYEDVLDCLDVGSDNTYHDQLINDYKSFIACLIDLRRSISALFKSNEEALLNPFGWPKRDESLYGKLASIRMHDIFEKWRMLHLKEKLEAVDELVGLEFETGFSRALGMLNILTATKGKNGLSYRVCYQGRQLKQLIVKPDGVKVDGGIFEKAKADLEAGKWFLDLDGKALPECGKDENQFFCRYGNYFAYRYEELSAFDRLVAVAKSLKNAPAP